MTFSTFLWFFKLVSNSDHRFIQSLIGSLFFLDGAFRRWIFGSKSRCFHRDPPVESVKLMNIAVEVPLHRWMSPRWPSATLLERRKSLHTFKNLDKHRRGAILKDKSKIIDLIKSNLNNNDYLMIKGSNSTGLNNLVNKLKTGKFNAL